MNTNIPFGKYKNRDIRWLLENDKNYVKWAIANLIESDSCPIKTFIKILKKQYDANNNENDINEFMAQDKLLKNAWYLQPGSELLLNYDLNPLPCGCVIEIEDDNAYEHIASEYERIDYYKSLGISINTLNRIKNTGFSDYDEDDLIFEIECGCVKEKGYFRRDIVKKMIDLRSKFLENKQYDLKQTLPSKMILNYWLPYETVRGIGTGKWCLFYDKFQEDANGQTELDRIYLFLLEKYKNGLVTTNFGFKCSTRRHNKNAGSNFTHGVIIIYCDENTKGEIISKLDEFGILKEKVYWKFHSGGYAKNGVKSSCCEYIPKSMRI